MPWRESRKRPKHLSSNLSSSDLMWWRSKDKMSWIYRAFNMVTTLHSFWTTWWTGPWSCVSELCCKVMSICIASANLPRAFIRTKFFFGPLLCGITLDADVDSGPYEASEWLQANVYLDVLPSGTKCFLEGERPRIPMAALPAFQWPTPSAKKRLYNTGSCHLPSLDYLRVSPTPPLSPFVNCQRVNVHCLRGVSRGFLDEVLGFSWVSQGFPRGFQGFPGVSSRVWDSILLGFLRFQRFLKGFQPELQGFSPSGLPAFTWLCAFHLFAFLLGGADLRCIVMLLLVRSSKRLVRAKHADMFAAAIQMSFKLLVIAGRIVTSEASLSVPLSCSPAQPLQGIVKSSKP